MTIAEEIQKLKQEKNAVILAHYYVNPEIQDIGRLHRRLLLSEQGCSWTERADHRILRSFLYGRKCKSTESGEKTVLMPDMHADCAMAHMADAETIQKMRDTYERSG